MKSVLWLLPLAAILAFPGCAPVSVESEGDAVKRQYGAGLQTRKLPFFSLGRTGTHTFRVSGLRERSFPYKLFIETTKLQSSDFFSNTPFETAVVRVEILSDSGQVLAGKTFRPNTWRVEGLGEFEQYFWNRREPGLPYMETYTVRVQVIRPSKRAKDRARLILR